MVVVENKCMHQLKERLAELTKKWLQKCRQAVLGQRLSYCCTAQSIATPRIAKIKIKNKILRLYLNW